MSKLNDFLFRKKNDHRLGALGRSIALTILLVLLISPLHAADKKRILIVSSYHREYLWSRDTHHGVCTALNELGYFDQKEQIDTFTSKDRVETSRAVLLKLWMDTKRKSDKLEMAASARRILEEAEKFRPDVVLLGDDNATNLIGTHYLDTQTPVVFWGVNIWPLKYGLLDSIERPGHNVTGVYQPGYIREGLEFLVKLTPEVRMLGVLADESETSMAKIKELYRLESAGKLPVKIVGTVVTNDEAAWKAGALKLAKKVDAFYLANHNTLRDASGKPVDQLALGAWYLRNILKPDIGDEKQFVEEGVLCVADDSGYKQGYEAVRMAHRILAEGADPALMPPVAPSRGALIVNKTRARMLGIEGRLAGLSLIEAFIERSEALDRYPDKP
ncbi:MAG: hypothetical protein H7834_04690 [Magnetococcus sp. YQC-9]